MDWTRRCASAPPAARIACAIARHLLDQTIERGHRTGDVLPVADGLLTVGPFKLFVDGSLNTRTAYCHDPYEGTDSRGLLELPPSELVPLMRRAASHGLVPAVHAIGDQANTIALDAFAEVGCPGRIEHAQLLAPEDVSRFAALGVIAGVQPAHQPDDRDVADRHWHGRTARACSGIDLGQGCFSCLAAAAGTAANSSPNVAATPSDGFWNSGRSQRMIPRLSSSARW